jgi:ATP-binding cassette subfamily C protein
LSSRSQESLVALLALVILLLTLLALFDYSRRRILARFGARLQERLELRVLHAVEARAPRAALGSGPVSGTKELDRLRGFFNSSALIAVLDFVWAPIFLGAVFLFHSLLGWVALSGIIVLVAIAGLRTVFSAHLTEDARAAAQTMNDVGRQIRDCQGTISSQGLAGPIVERWRSARHDARDMSIVLADRVTWFTTISKHIRLLFQIMILALGANLVLNNQLSVGGMVASFILLGRIFLPVEGFLKSLPTINEARTNWRTLHQVLGDAPQDVRSHAALAITGGLQVRDLRLRSDTAGAFTAPPISFSVAPGKVVQISGGLGAGKTLLARALMGQVPLASGSVSMGDFNIEQFTVEELAQVVGYLPEDIGFFPGTVLQNIARLTPGASEAAVVAAARRAGAHRMITRLPEGYRTKLDREGCGLSLGERQRIALARALFGRPKVLVLDDSGDTMPVSSGILTAGGPAVVILSRRARRLMVDSVHYQLRDGALVRQNDMPALPAVDKKPANLRAPQLVKGCAL